MLTARDVANRTVQARAYHAYTCIDYLTNILERYTGGSNTSVELTFDNLELTQKECMVDGVHPTQLLLDIAQAFRKLEFEVTITVRGIRLSWEHLIVDKYVRIDT